MTRNLRALKSALSARGWFCEQGSEGELVATIEIAARPGSETQIVVWEDGEPEVRSIYQTKHERVAGAVMLEPPVFAALRLVESAVTPRVSHEDLLRLATDSERLLIAMSLKGFDRSVAALERLQASVQARVNREAVEGQAVFDRFHAEVEADLEAGIAGLVADVSATIATELPPAFIVRRRGAGDIDAYVDQLNDEDALEAAVGAPDA